MPTPPKPMSLRTGHISNEKKDFIAECEADLLTGEVWREYAEVRRAPVAHKFFKRLERLYSLIDKNDAMTEPVINRYCLLQAECADFEKKRELFSRNLAALMESTALDEAERFKLEAAMQKTIIAVDQQIMSKRRMLLDIEKETLMTLKAQMASIPKRPAGESKPKNKFMVSDNG